MAKDLFIPTLSTSITSTSRVRMSKHPHSQWPSTTGTGTTDPTNPYHHRPAVALAHHLPVLTHAHHAHANHPGAATTFALTPSTPSFAQLSPHISEIIPGLYLGDLVVAENAPDLRALRITHVLSAMRGRVDVPRCVHRHAQVPLDDLPFAELAAHLPATTAFIHDALRERQHPDRDDNVGVDDNGRSAGHQHHHQPHHHARYHHQNNHHQNDSIHTQHQHHHHHRPAEEEPAGARVLVHCVQGVSRSASVVAAYLMARYGWSAAQAVQYIQSKRPIVDPNFGFLAQLREYGEQLRRGGGVALHPVPPTRP